MEWKGELLHDGEDDDLSSLLMENGSNGALQQPRLVRFRDGWCGFGGVESSEEEVSEVRPWLWVRMTGASTLFDSSRRATPRPEYD
jgi:hypothetical protein